MNYTLLGYGVISIFAIITAILFFIKWKKGKVSVDDIIDKYIDILIDSIENFVYVMKMDHDKFKDEEDFKTTIIGLAIRDFKKVLKEAGVSDRLIDLIIESNELNKTVVQIIDDSYNKHFVTIKTDTSNPDENADVADTVDTKPSVVSIANELNKLSQE